MDTRRTGPRQRLRTNGDGQLAIGDRQGEVHPALQARGQRGNQRPVDRVNLEVLDSMDPLSGQVAGELPGSLWV